MTASQAVWLVCSAMILCAGCSRSPDGEPTPNAPTGQFAPDPEPPARKIARLPVELAPRPAPREPRSSDWFEDIARPSGVAFVARDGNEAGFFQLIESIGAGGAAVDFDRDGFPDLALNGGGRLGGTPIEVSGVAGALFRNDQHGGFEDVTTVAGFTPPGFYSHGVTVADFDADGFPDVVVAGFGGVRLYWNDGNGGLDEVGESAGLGGGSWFVAPIAADYDGDGLVDLYFVTYADWQPKADRICPNDRGLRDVCAPTPFAGTGDQLWRNLGDGRFENVSAAVGLIPGNRGLGAVACDFDENGWIDLFVANDVEENQLYQNLGPDRPFSERGVLAGVAFSDDGQREASMGVDIGDFDGDLRPDLWYTNYSAQDNSLLQNAGSGFAPASGRTGLKGVSRAWVGFGTGFADFDGDGWEDLYVLNGHVAYDRRDSPYYQPAQLFRNEGGDHFEEISEFGGPYFSVPRSGRGGIVADFQNDGGLDLAIVHQNDPVALLSNRRPTAHWIAFDPVGTGRDRDAIGVKLTLTSGGRERARWRRGGGGYLSYSDRRVWFALESEEPVTVHVRWPGGRLEDFSDQRPGATHVLVEGTGERVD